MVNVVMYASASCSYCRRARALLDSKGVEYTVIDVDSHPQRWDEMRERSRRNTVPQIFIDSLHVGGFDDMAALEKRGKLDWLLNKN